MSFNAFFKRTLDGASVLACAYQLKVRSKNPSVCLISLKNTWKNDRTLIRKLNAISPQ